MSDTVKIPRPKFKRSEHGPKGRVEHDSRGNAVWVKTRAADTDENAQALSLTVEDPVVQQTYPELPATRKTREKKPR